MRARSWVPQYFALSLVWGSSFAFTEAGLTIFSPLGITAIRHMIGALVLVWLVMAIGKSHLVRELAGRLWGQMLILALFLNVIPGYLFAYAQNHISTMSASVVNAATPLLTLLMIVLAFRNEKVLVSQFIGVVIGFTGVLVALGIRPGNVTENEPIGVISVFGAVLCYAFAIPFARKFVTPHSDSPTLLATLQVGIAAIILAVAFVLEMVSSPATFTLAESSWIWIQILILGAGTGIAYVWHFQVIDRVGSAVASSITYPTLLVSLVIGALALGESFGSGTLLGSTLLVFGSWFALRTPVSRRRRLRPS